MPKGGRWPVREYQPDERVAISWRLPGRLKQWVDAQAEASGRSLSQQIEIMLQRASDADRDFFGAATCTFGRVNSGVAFLLSLILSDAEGNSAEGWFDHPEAAAVMAAAVAKTLEIMLGVKITVERPPEISEATWQARHAMAMRPVRQLRDYLADDHPATARLLDELILDRLTTEQKRRLRDWTPE